jgi:hypothetical protein
MDDETDELIQRQGRYYADVLSAVADAAMTSIDIAATIVRRLAQKGFLIYSPEEVAAQKAREG